MGVISILLGAISFFCFTGAGAILANIIVDKKTLLAMSVTSLETVSNTSLIIGVVGIFAFIGLLIGVSLIMQGLTYNKLSKMSAMQKRR